MNDALITILSLSVSGSILTLILFAGKPFLKNRVSKAFSYYIWLLVLLRLLVPIAAPVNVMGTLFGIEQPGTNNTVTEQTGIPVGNGTVQTGKQAAVSSNTQAVSPEPQNNETAGTQAPADIHWSFSIWNFIKNNLLWIWLAGSVISLGWFITAYTCYSRRIRLSCVTPHNDDLEVFEQMRDDKRVRMACSSYVATPMFIGALRPVIVLPQLAYIRNGMDRELRNILSHELTHYRRKDVLYKWLVVTVTSLHWFNPLMLLIRKEISRVCELSCDEAVISGMSADKKQFYGNTLLALSANRKLPSGILATTLCEDKKELKERLISIMRYKKKSAWAVALTLVLALLLAGCAAALGAATSPSSEVAPENSAQTTGTAYSREMDGTIINWHDTGSFYSLDENGNVILSYDNGKNTGKAPLILQPSGSEEGISIYNTGFYISDEKTAIAYGDSAGTEQVTILISDDMGKTWNSANIDLNGAAASWKCIGFTSQNDGWLVVCSFVGMGQEQHYIYMTSDGGKTWTPVHGNIDDVYGRMLSGAGFVNDKIGFLCFRYESDFQPAICMTRDGGLTWNKLSVNLPEEYSGYNKTPFSPVFDGTKIILPVLLTGDSAGGVEIYLTSSDEGHTWQCETTMPTNSAVAGGTAMGNNAEKSQSISSTAESAQTDTNPNGYSPAATSPQSTSGSILNVKILDISLFDMNGNKLQATDGWIHVQKNTKIVVTYSGNADEIDYIFTPTGTETYNLQKIIGNSFVGPNDTKAEFVWSPSSDPSIGYISVSISQGNYSVKSDYINVIYQT